MKPFWEAIKETEGINDTVDKILPMMDGLLAHLEHSSKATYADNDFMKERVWDAWKKLGEYYTLSDSTIAYFAATVLNPCAKYSYFQQTWTTDLLRNAFKTNKKRLLELYETYCDQFSEAQKDYNTDPQSTSNQPASQSSKALFWASRMKPPKKPKDELQLYLSEPLYPEQECWHPIKWWLEESNQRRFPILSRLALDILSVPAMSSSTERFFSDAKLTIGPLRMKLLATTIEAL